MDELVDMSAENSSDVDNDASLAQRIGLRLRALRSARKLTLAELSKLSSVSVSYLSAVENGVNLPSLQILARLTEALGASIPSVLADEGSPHVHLARIPDELGRVAASHPLLQLDIAITRLESGDSGPAPIAFEGKDVFVYVVSGQINLLVDDESHRLTPGDALDARLPTRVTWMATTPALLTWTTCPHPS